MSFTRQRSLGDGRFMRIGTHRILYYGLLGEPTVRNFGSATLYASEQKPFQINFGEGWQTRHLAWVRSYTPHRIRTRDRHLAVVMLEPEYIDMEKLSTCIERKLNKDAPSVKARVLEGVSHLQQQIPGSRLSDREFDQLLFRQAPPRRRLDPRVSRVLFHICENTADPCSASFLADIVGLSLSRFLHLFKAETGVSLRKYRAWRRARSLLYHVRSASTLTDIALKTGYPDSTHFSHSIRRIYGLSPSDIVNGSRRLMVCV